MKFQPPLSFFRAKIPRRRAGVSPVIATTILLGITVALGLGLWSFANAGVGTATQDYAETVTEYGRFTTDKFVVPSVAYDYSSDATNADDITVYIYNSGKFETQITSVIIACRDCDDATDSLPDYTFGVITLDLSHLDPNGSPQSGESTDGKVPSKELRHLDFDASAAGADFRSLAGTDGYTYQMQVISDTGAYQTMYQKY